jgi:hypothetical protein
LLKESLNTYKIFTMDPAHKSESAPSNVPSYASHTIRRRRRNKRRIRHAIAIDTYMLNRIRQLPPTQNTNDPFINQFFNGSNFR